MTRSTPEPAAPKPATLVARLVEVLTRLGADAPPQVLLRHLASSAVGLLGAAGSAFVGLDRDTGRLTIQAIAHLPTGLLGVDFPLAGSAVGELAASGRRSLVGTSTDFPHLNEAVFPEGAGELAVGVTTVAGELTGGLYVSLRPGTSLTAEELEVLELLAGHAGIALQHAEALAEVRSARGQREAVVEAMLDGLAVLDGQGRVTSWNRALAAMTGVPAEGALGRAAPLPLPRPGRVLDHQLASGRWLELLVSTVPGTEDRVLSVRDISGPKQLEAAKDLFLATASHELRTPLTVLRGFCETLLHRWDDLDDDARRGLVRTMLARTEGMTGLVEQLLRGSQAGVPVLVGPSRTFDLAAVARAAVDRVSGSSPRHPVSVLAPHPVLATGDPAAVEPVLGQLLENAVKYSPHGGPVQVQVVADTDTDTAVLRVADRGVGIGPQDLDRVFERFVRGEPATDGGQPGGAGLGLWIVRRYVEAQDGTVALQPRAGGGTVVEVRLPAAADGPGRSR